MVMNDDLRQAHLPFDGDPRPPRGPDGLDRWHAQRAEALKELSRRLGVPVGARVRVTLSDGVELTGTLAVVEEDLWVPPPEAAAPRLRIGRCTFGLDDLESCVRED